MSAFGNVVPPFGKGHFGVRELALPIIPGKSGVVRKASRGNQTAALDDVCVVIPIQKYQLTNDVRGRSRTEVIRTNQPNDCIAYRAVVGVIIVQLTWDMPDDFDLFVFEPNGTPITRFSPNSPSGGRLLNDNLIRSCKDATTAGREQVTYRTRATPLNGVYRVQVRHFRACGNSVGWNLQVVIDGVVVLDRAGTSNENIDSVVLDDTFRYRRA